MSFFKSIGNFFKSIGQAIGKIFSPQNINKVAGLAKEAVPIVEKIAEITPTKADDLLVKAAKNLGISVNEIISSTNELIRDGGRQRLAAEALKLKLLELVQNGKQVKLDDFTTAIPGHPNDEVGKEIQR